MSDASPIGFGPPASEVSGAAPAADEVVARLNKQSDGDVGAFDAVYDDILHMSDALSEGIVKQFPEKFGTAAVSTTGKR